MGKFKDEPPLIQKKWKIDFLVRDTIPEAESNFVKGKAIIRFAAATLREFSGQPNSDLIRTMVGEYR